MHRVLASHLDGDMVHLASLGRTQRRLGPRRATGACGNEGNHRNKSDAADNNADDGSQPCARLRVEYTSRSASPGTFPGRATVVIQAAGDRRVAVTWGPRPGVRRQRALGTRSSFRIKRTPLGLTIGLRRVTRTGVARVIRVTRVCARGRPRARIRVRIRVRGRVRG